MDDLEGKLRAEHEAGECWSDCPYPHPVIGLAAMLGMAPPERPDDDDEDDELS